ncbi:MAG: hypothetical protein V4539_22050 [Bacteroidota bacterium]
MATVTKEGLNGAIGAVVFYTMNGKSYARSKPHPESSRHKKKLQHQRNLFGRVSSLSAGMASAIRTELNCPFGLHAYNALRGWTYAQYKENQDSKEWLLQTNPNRLCELNPGASLQQSLKAGISVEDMGGGRLLIGIDSFNPAKDIKAPAGAGSLNLKLICAREIREAGSASYFVLTLAQYPVAIVNKNLAVIEMELDTHGSKGDLACLVLAVEFRSGDEHSSGIINNPLFLPAAGMALGKLG